MFLIPFLTTASFLTSGSYNSFINQVGFCKLQGFRTTSRNTSNGPSVFLDGRVLFGVGLSNVQFGDSMSSCGRCIQIHHVANFGVFDFDLTSFQEKNTANGSFQVMVFDQCKDPVCTSGFLDFDVYTPNQPVKNGNPSSLIWEFVPCPVRPGENIKLLFCLSNTCFENSVSKRIHELIHEADPYYWSLYIFNHRLPITKIYLSDYDVYLEDNNGWVWNHGLFNYTKPFTIVFDNHLFFDVILTNGSPDDSFHGGIMVQTDVQN